MSHVVVDPTLSEGFEEVSFEDVDELYLVQADQILEAGDLIPNTAGVPRLKGNRTLTDVQLDAGQVMKIQGATRDFGTHTVPCYLPPTNDKLRDLYAASKVAGQMWKGNAFYRDGSGFSFFTYINNVGPSGEDDFRHEFDISPFDVQEIGDLATES